MVTKQNNQWFVNGEKADLSNNYFCWSESYNFFVVTRDHKKSRFFPQNHIICGYETQAEAEKGAKNFQGSRSDTLVIKGDPNLPKPQVHKTQIF